MASGAQGKTFLLGVGCQKGGTTWLHDYLSQSDQTDLGLIKEYHIFDALEVKSCRSQYRKVMRAKARKVPADTAPGAIGALKRKLLTDTDEYFNYFAELLNRDGIIVTGDITPEYCDLSVSRLKSIKQGFAAKEIGVKVIFLMRDPVERIWSSVRMKLRTKKTSKRKPELVAAGDQALLLKAYQQRPYRFRTAYDRTIRALDEAFAPEDVLYGFYEQLFTPDSTRRICDFLGIRYVEPEFGKAVNPSPKTSEISEPAAREVAQAYREVYDFVEDRFGADFIRGIWPHAEAARA